MISHSLVSDLNGFELSNLTLMISVIVATVQSRITGINPGGLISAAFIILAAGSSFYLSLLILGMGLLISIIFKRFFSHVYSGREPMFYMAFMSVVGMLGVGSLLMHFVFHGTIPISLLPGLIVPAIIASAIQKQGAVVTYTYLFSATAISAACLFGVYELGLAAGHSFSAIDDTIADRQQFAAYSRAYMALASVVICFLIYKYKRVKFAGYIILPFLATVLIESPLNFVLVIGLACIAYAITALARRYTLILGIGRYAFVLILSMALVWTSEVLLLSQTTAFSPFLGTTIFASLAITVIVNDTTLYGIRRSVPAFMTGLAAITLLLVTVNGISSKIHHQAPKPVVYHQAATVHKLLY